MQKKRRIVVAGQCPPPFGGQAVMIARLLAELTGRPGLRSEHWAFYFTPGAQQARRVGIGKIVALAAALGRLAWLRARGPIDLLVYPAGGPQLVPVVRDLCLLPFALCASRRLVIHFHAGGIAEALPRLPGVIQKALSWLCRRADGALVMTEFGRRDPQSVGIERIVSVPHTMDDTFDPARVRRGEGPIRLLYVGHLCPDKGTPALVEAFAMLRASGMDARLVLVGECLAPYTEGELSASIERLGIRDFVERPGVLKGEAKWDRFACADLFVFPSVAPYESFGLVIVEAMMWALPVVLTDWRGNAEVLGDPPGGVCFAPAAELADRLGTALRKACEERGRWQLWGDENRAAYEARFKSEAFANRLSSAIESLL